jgi:hypothetical protein
MTFIHYFFNKKTALHVFITRPFSLMSTKYRRIFISAVSGRSNKKRKEKSKLTLGRLALVAGT